MDFNIPHDLKGLTEAELQISREKFGYNQLKKTEKRNWLKLLFNIFREPMLILLIIITIIYLVVGNYGGSLLCYWRLFWCQAFLFTRITEVKKRWML